MEHCEWLFILIVKVPHHKLGNFIRAKVPSYPKKNILGDVGNSAQGMAETAPSPIVDS